MFLIISKIYLFLFRTHVIYGRDVQDIEDNTIPADVAEKILRFARAAQAVATMRVRLALSMGSVSMVCRFNRKSGIYFQNIWACVANQ